MLPRNTIQLVVEAQDRGIDVEKILQEILYPSIKTQKLQPDILLSYRTSSFF